MTLESFSPPAFLDDLDDQQKDAWSEWISQQFKAGRAGQPEAFDFDGPREQFFNPTKTDLAEDATTLDISWTGFPRNVAVTSVSDRQRWRRADASRDVQDEYCEWSVTRDPATTKITRVTFTCEGPEYWEFLARVAPAVTLGLYREFVSPDVQEGHLFDAAGVYDPRNRWNSTTTGGAMHLIQVNNSLSAEIELAAGSSVVRKIGGRELMDARELIECGKYGGAERHSDPHIGERVNSLTRQRADVTLQDPVGLYFNDLLTTGWQTPDGSDPKSYWKYVRGAKGKFVRAVYEVPAAVGYMVGDIKISGRAIEYGAQIADFVSIKLTGVAHRFGKSLVQPMTGCRRRATGGGGFESMAVIPVEAAIARNRPVTRYGPGSVPIAAAAAKAAAPPVPEHLSESSAAQWEVLAIRERLPAELAIKTIQYEIASRWADVVVSGQDLEAVLKHQGVTASAAILVAADRHWADRLDLAESFFLIFDGGGIDELPTAACIRSKLPPGRKPTEEDLRRAFRECSKRP